MSYHAGDMVRLNPETLAYVSKKIDTSPMIGTVIKSRKREVRNEPRRIGALTEIAVIDMVEVMWSNGLVQKIDGRYLEKITARMIEQEKDNG
tara:strand:- start:103 stop:378 length:276 start_codon:yes stop_codon:yes gene_type:complete